MKPSRTVVRTGIAMLVFFVLASGQVAVAWQVATPAAGCPGNKGTPIAPVITSVATPIGPDSNMISHGGPAVDHVSFVDALRVYGVTVLPGDAIKQPFLRADGIVLELSGCGLSHPVEVQSFAYEDASTAAADAAQIGPDGNAPTMMITWIGTPHFYLAERLFVLYVGDDQSTIALLTRILGSPFVG